MQLRAMKTIQHYNEEANVCLRVFTESAICAWPLITRESSQANVIRLRSTDCALTWTLESRTYRRVSFVATCLGNAKHLKLPSDEQVIHSRQTVHSNREGHEGCRGYAEYHYRQKLQKMAIVLILNTMDAAASACRYSKCGREIHQAVRA